MRALTILAFFLLLTQYVSAQKPTFDPKTLTVQWEVIENNYQNKTQTLSAFTLTNTGKTTIPATGWSLFFNFVRDIKPGTATGNVQIDLINGDFFRLSPKSGFQPIKPGASVRIEFVSGAWVLNFTDAPSGLYWVWDSQPQTGIAITNLSIKPSTQPKQTTRFPGDKPGFISPQTIYEQNKAIADIPENQLPKILPTPLSYYETGSTFLLDAGITIMADTDFLREANYLAGELATVIGQKPTISTTGKTGKQIQFVKSQATPGAYQLSVKPDGVTISASTREGIFYGIQSLKMLLPPTAWAKAQPSLTIPTRAIALK